MDLQRTQERGAQQLRRAEVEAIVGANAHRLLARAQVADERGEAASAERLADRALSAERLQEANAPVDPTSRRELPVERITVAGSLRRKQTEAAADAA